MAQATASTSSSSGGKSSLKRDAGRIGLLYAGVGGMIGSGWLLGPLHAAQEAGPLSIGTWIIGAVAVLSLALCYAELSTLFPKSGALIHMSYVSHGQLVGRIWSWILFLAYVTVAPVEAQAVLTYANNYIPGLIDRQTEVLTPIGFVLAAILLGIMVAVNFLAIRLVLKINSYATSVKILIPAGTVLVLLLLSFHTGNLGNAVTKPNIDGMFSAVSSAGVFFALFGFRQAIDLAGESSDPSRDLPFAVIGTVLIGAVLYIGLQFAFLLAIDPKILAEHGWHDLSFTGISGPFAALAVASGAAWWGVVLYGDAILSPAACGFIYTTTTARIVMAAGETGGLPSIMDRINARGVPWTALLLAYAVGCIFFFPFPSWQKLITYISSVTVLSYGIGPILLVHLRRTTKDLKSPFRLPGAFVIAPFAFISANLVIFWAGFTTVNFLFLLLIVIFVGYIAYELLVARRPLGDLGLDQAWWLAPYFGGLWLLSYIGPVALKGVGVLGLYTGMLAIAILSLLVFWLALRVANDQATTQNAIDHLQEDIRESKELPGEA